MKKRNNKYFYTLILIFTLFISKNGISQNEKAIEVKFEIDGQEINFAKDIKIILSVNGKDIEPLMYLNGFISPDFKGAKEADVCFIYRRKRYQFKDLPISKFETNWVFGISKTAIEKKYKKKYYLKFNPKDGGDGTQVTIFE